MNITVRHRGVRSTLLQFEKLDKESTKVAREKLRWFGTAMITNTRKLVPQDTGFMHDHVRSVWSKGGLMVVTGWFAEDFVGKQVSKWARSRKVARDRANRAKARARAGMIFYPPHVELGTKRQRAKPSLTPAFHELTTQVIARIRESLRKLELRPPSKEGVR